MTKRDEIQSRLTELIRQEKDLILLVSIRIGKTKIALDAIQEGESVLVIYPVAPIKEGWEEDLVKFPPKSTDIKFSTTQSIKKWKDKEVDYLILDEPQLYSKAQRDIINTIKYKKRVALTGTLKRSTENKLWEELKLIVKVRYELKDAIADKLVKDYRIRIHYSDLNQSLANVEYQKFKTNLVGTEKQVYDYYLQQMNEADGKGETKEERKKWAAIYKKYQGLITNFIYNSPTLHETAFKLVYQLRDKKVLIYSMRSDIAHNLSLGNSYTSDNRNEVLFEDFKVSKSGHMGLVNCAQAGVTFLHLDGVIFHSAESNTEKFQQKIGRSLLYEFDEEFSEIHVCCLKNTIHERWVKLACNSLDHSKIIHVYNGREYNQTEWVKMHNPDKELYIYTNTGGYVYLADQTKPQQQFSDYFFVDSPTKKYSLNKDRLIKV